jgi:hypothetical protein
MPGARFAGQPSNLMKSAIKQQNQVADREFIFYDLNKLGRDRNALTRLDSYSATPLMTKKLKQGVSHSDLHNYAGLSKTASSQ